ncbi:MAG: glycoside hydrolase family 95 protein, partial [Chitinophagaceae bacterium]
METKRMCLVLLLLLRFALPSTAQQAPLKLWYDKPARQWEETLPLGNGRIGMMPDGGILKEKVVLNEITMWSGSEQDANNYEAYKNLPAIRRLLQEGKNDQAQALVNKTFICKGAGSGHGNGANVPFGCYQVLGNLNVQFDYNGADSASLKPEAYRRELSLDNAIATCSYRINGINYRREYFTSFDDDISIIK